MYIKIGLNTFVTKISFLIIWQCDTKNAKRNKLCIYGPVSKKNPTMYKAGNSNLYMNTFKYMYICNSEGKFLNDNNFI